MDSYRLLLADSDRALRDELATELRADGYTVICSPTERALGTAVGFECPDLILLGDLDRPAAGLSPGSAPGTSATTDTRGR